MNSRVNKAVLPSTPDTPESEQALLRRAASHRKDRRSRTALIDSVARQVSSSQRLEGVEVSPAEIKRILMTGGVVPMVTQEVLEVE